MKAVVEELVIRHFMPNHCVACEMKGGLEVNHRN